MHSFVSLVLNASLNFIQINKNKNDVVVDALFASLILNFYFPISLVFIAWQPANINKFTVDLFILCLCHFFFITSCSDISRGKLNVQYFFLKKFFYHPKNICIPPTNHKIFSKLIKKLFLQRFVKLKISKAIERTSFTQNVSPLRVLLMNIVSDYQKFCIEILVFEEKLIKEEKKINLKSFVFRKFVDWNFRKF